MGIAKSRYGRVRVGDYTPYGALVGASKELLSMYYYYGVCCDENWPELPTVELEDEVVDPLDVVHKQDVARIIHKVLLNLTRRERGALFMRFGIGYGQEHTLDDIGKAFDITRERARQIINKALRKCYIDAGLELMSAQELCNVKLYLHPRLIF